LSNKSNKYYKADAEQDDSNVPGTGRKPLAPSGTGTGACWAAWLIRLRQISSEFRLCLNSTPWLYGRIPVSLGGKEMREVSQKAVVIPLMERMGRVGSWLDPARYVRSAIRDGDSPGSRINNLGFRLVRP